MAGCDLDQLDTALLFVATWSQDLGKEDEEAEGLFSLRRNLSVILEPERVHDPFCSNTVYEKYADYQNLNSWVIIPSTVRFVVFLQERRSQILKGKCLW